MKIRISGEMEAPSTEELTPEASAFVAALFKLSQKLRPQFDAMIPEPAFMLTSGGNSFFSYMEMNRTRLGEAQPGMCCFVVCPPKNAAWVPKAIIEFECHRAQVERLDDKGTILGSFGFDALDLEHPTELVGRFRNLLKAMLFAGAWGGPQELRSNPLLTAPQRELVWLLD